MSIDLKRKLARRGGEPVELNEAITSSVNESRVSDRNPEKDLLLKEQVNDLENLLEGLSEDHKTTLILREVEGLSYKEICKITGVNKGTIMSRLFYARKKLQEKIQELENVSEEEELARMKA